MPVIRMRLLAASKSWLTLDTKTWEVPGGLNAGPKEHPELRKKSNRYTGNGGCEEERA